MSAKPACGMIMPLTVSLVANDAVQANPASPIVAAVSTAVNVGAQQVGEESLLQTGGEAEVGDYAAQVAAPG